MNDHELRFQLPALRTLGGVFVALYRRAGRIGLETSKVGVLRLIRNRAHEKKPIQKSLVPTQWKSVESYAPRVE